jgi:hypothetical protein
LGMMLRFYIVEILLLQWKTTTSVPRPSSHQH